MTEFTIRKDSDPLKTVEHIRSILSKHGIFVRESNWSSFSPNCHSLTLEAINLPGFSTNGKGVSKAYALASAYGEFMERIQNRFMGLQGEKNFGEMKDFDHFFEDQRLVPTRDLPDAARETVESILGMPIEKSGVPSTEEQVLLPYFHFNSGKVVELPWLWMLIACGTNGMCSGNTPAEALTQGLCEIAERYVLRRIFSDPDITLPTVSEAEMKSDGIQRLRDELCTAGFRLIVKDCSLGGAYPVLGALCIDVENGTYSFNLGADPLFDVALTRCITEAFQGGRYEGDLSQLFSESRFSPFRTDERKREWDYMRAVVYSAGDFPGRIFYNKTSAKCNIDTAFSRDIASNLQALRWTVDRLIADGKDVYIRDVSFLGFPAYHIYIPTMSETWSITQSYMDHMRRGPSTRKCLLNLTRASSSEIKTTAEALEEAYDALIIPHLSASGYIQSRTSTLVKNGAGLSCMESTEWWLSLLFARTGNYKKSHYWLNKYISTYGKNAEIDPYTVCTLAYFRMKSENETETVIRNTLSEIFGDTLAAEVTNDLVEPEKVFDNLTLPQCGDCDECPVVDGCLYPEWRKITKSIYDEMKQKQIDQRRVATVFERHVQLQLGQWCP